MPVRCAPAGVRPLTPGIRCAGRARPARHVGSVDIFLEALEAATPGEVLVVDNGGRLDEACVVGAVSTGPLRLDRRPPDSLDRAAVGACIVSPDDVVIGDADGVMFVSSDRLAEVMDAADYGFREHLRSIGGAVEE